MVQPKSYKGIKVEGKIVGMVGSDVQCSGLNVLPAHPSFDSFAPPAWESLMVRPMRSGNCNVLDAKKEKKTKQRS